MSAPHHNQFWKARSQHGRPKRFTPDMLWEACCEYFAWVDQNPLWESKPFHHQGEITYATVPKMRAMTLDGLCLFLSIDPTTWRQWRHDEDLSPVITRVEMVIRDQKFSGAAAGLFNARIISRDLGLAEHTDSTHHIGGENCLKGLLREVAGNTLKPGDE